MVQFGAELQRVALPKWKGNYIQYKELEKAIEVFTGQNKDQSTVTEVTHFQSSFLRLGPNPETTPEARLLNLIMAELERIGKFTKLEEESIRTQLQQVDRATSTTESKLDQIGEQITDLKSFQQINFRGFRKIIKKYDKWSKSSVMPWIMGKVAQSPFMQVDYDGLLLIFNRVAGKLTGRRDVANAWKGTFPQSQGQVYIVDTKDSMRVRVQLAKNLGLSFVGGGAKAPRSQETYYDNEQLVAYTACLEGTTSQEFVSVSSTEDGNDVEVAVERPGGSRQEDTITRVEASRTLNAGQASSNAVVSSAQALMRRTGMGAVAMGAYQRSVFRDQANGITAVLDEDVRISRVQAWDGKALDTEFFPYSLLTVHSDPGKSKDAPKWLSSICQSASLSQVAHFTLGVHAVGSFCAKATGVALPSWHHRIANAVDQEREEAAGKAAVVTRKPKEDAPVEGSSTKTRERAASRALLHAFDTSPEEKDLFAIGAEPVTVPGAEGGLNAPLLGRAPGDDDSAKNSGGWLKMLGSKANRPVRKAIVAVQPKTLNSLERTYLEWIHFVTVVATLGVFMMHAGHEEIIGRLLVMVSVLFVMRVHHVFKWRAEGLDLKKDIEYHDQFTPIALVAGIIVGVSWAAMSALGVIEK